MGKGQEPYSEFCAERLFEKTEEERLTETLNEIIKNDPATVLGQNVTVTGKRTPAYR